MKRRTDAVGWMVRVGVLAAVTVIVLAVACSGCNQSTNPFAQQAQKPEAPQQQDGEQTTFGGPQYTINQRNVDGVPIGGDWVPVNQEDYAGRQELTKATTGTLTVDVGDGKSVTLAQASADNLQIYVQTFNTSASTTPTASQGQTSTQATTGTQTTDTTASPKAESGLAGTFNVPLGPNSQASGSSAAGAGGSTVTLDAASTQRLTGQVVEGLAKDPDFLKSLGQAVAGFFQPPVATQTPADADTSGVPVSVPPTESQ